MPCFVCAQGPAYPVHIAAAASWLCSPGSKQSSAAVLNRARRAPLELASVEPGPIANSNGPETVKLLAQARKKKDSTQLCCAPAIIVSRYPALVVVQSMELYNVGTQLCQHRSPNGPL